MLTLNNLVGIETEKRNAVKATLDGLLTFNVGGKLQPVITGYSWFDRLAASDRVVAFSHSHETEAYKQAMLADLSEEGFIYANDRIRNKGSAYLWDPEFSHRDEHGRLLPGKAIRDIRTGRKINLKKYKLKLANYPEFRNAFGNLVCDDYLEWQIDLPFNTKAELLRMSKIFVAGAHGLRHWPTPHDLPMLVIGESALRYLNDPLINGNFGQATRTYLIENSNEISFIINKSLRRLRACGAHLLLNDLGFENEVCLANLPFIAYLNRFEDQR